MIEIPREVGKLASESKNLAEISNIEFQARFLDVCEQRLGDKFIVVELFPNDEDMVGFVTMGVVRKTSEMISIMTTGIYPYKEIYPDAGDIGFPIIWIGYKCKGDDFYVGPVIGGFSPDRVAGRVRVEDQEMIVRTEVQDEEAESTVILFGEEAQGYIESNPDLQKIGQRLNHAVDSSLGLGL